MSKRFVLTGFVAGLAVLAMAFDEVSAFKSFMQEQMGLYTKAIKEKDLGRIEKVIMANFTPGFKDTDLKGAVRDRAKVIEGMQRNVSSLQSLDFISLKIEDVKITGNKAVTVEHMVMKGWLQSANPAKPDKLFVDSTWTGQYVKQNGRWMCTATKTTKEKVLVNGKAVS